MDSHSSDPPDISQPQQNNSIPSTTATAPIHVIYSQPVTSFAYPSSNAFPFYSLPPVLNTIPIVQTMGGTVQGQTIHPTAPVFANTAHIVVQSPPPMGAVFPTVLTADNMKSMPFVPIQNHLGLHMPPQMGVPPAAESTRAEKEPEIPLHVKKYMEKKQQTIDKYEQQMKREHAASIILQKYWRGRMARKQYGDPILNEMYKKEHPLEYFLEEMIQEVMKKEFIPEVLVEICEDAYYPFMKTTSFNVYRTAYHVLEDVLYSSIRSCVRDALNDLVEETLYQTRHGPPKDAFERTCDDFLDDYIVQETRLLVKQLVHEQVRDHFHTQQAERIYIELLDQVMDEMGVAHQAIMDSLLYSLYHEIMDKEMDDEMESIACSCLLEASRPLLRNQQIMRQSRRGILQKSQLASFILDNLMDEMLSWVLMQNIASQGASFMIMDWVDKMMDEYMMNVLGQEMSSVKMLDLGVLDYKQTESTLTVKSTTGNRRKKSKLPDHPVESKPAKSPKSKQKHNSNNKPAISIIAPSQLDVRVKEEQEFIQQDKTMSIETMDRHDSTAPLNAPIIEPTIETKPTPAPPIIPSANPLSIEPTRLILPIVHPKGLVQSTDTSLQEFYTTYEDGELVIRRAESDTFNNPK